MMKKRYIRKDMLVFLKYVVTAFFLKITSLCNENLKSTKSPFKI